MILDDVYETSCGVRQRRVEMYFGRSADEYLDGALLFDLLRRAVSTILSTKANWSSARLQTTWWVSW